MTVGEVYRKLQKQGHKGIYANLLPAAPYMAVGYSTPEGPNLEELPAVVAARKILRRARLRSKVIQVGLGERLLIESP